MIVWDWPNEWKYHVAYNLLSTKTELRQKRILGTQDGGPWDQEHPPISHHNSDDDSSVTPTDPGLGEKIKYTKEGKKIHKNQKDTKDTPGGLTDDDYHLLKDKM